MASLVKQRRLFRADPAQLDYEILESSHRTMLKRVLKPQYHVASSLILPMLTL